MTDLQALGEAVEACCGDRLLATVQRVGEFTIEVTPQSAGEVMKSLRDHESLRFDQLIDLCGVDYTTYATESQAPEYVENSGNPLLAVVYHLLSTVHNRRIRVRVRLDPEHPVVDSMAGLWPVADWFEREAFDMYGILFVGHPDLRRLLTDYGFIGHPFRKDFPLSGHVEMRYDEKRGRVVYQPVSIEPRVLVPRVIRTEGYGG